jgi:FtsP/CotA-like multicopper oxidase with cupredoxin domain
MAIRQTMSPWSRSRRDFLKAAGAATGVAMLAPGGVLAESAADYTLTIATKPLEIAPNRILSVTTYNGLFPGPLLRFKEGQQVTIDVHNQTDTPEQLHWHGQLVSAASITPTSALGQTSPRVNTAGSWGPSTSSRRITPETTTARSFSL